MIHILVCEPFDTEQFDPCQVVPRQVKCIYTRLLISSALIVLSRGDCLCAQYELFVQPVPVRGVQLMAVLRVVDVFDFVFLRSEFGALLSAATFDI